MMTPKVSVVMPVYNSEKYLQRAIDSILGQTFKDFEFLIIDDGSTDNTSKILEDVKRSDSRVRIFKNEENVGLIVSLNKGLQLAKGKYVARMDSDDISRRERLQIQVEYMEENPDVVLVGTAMTHIYPNRQPYRRIHLETDGLKDKLLLQNRLCHGSVLFKLEAVKEIGGYRAELEYAEDYDLWTRLSEKYEIRNIDQSLYLWRTNPGGNSESHWLEQQRAVALIKDCMVARRSGKIEPIYIPPKSTPNCAILIPTYNRPIDLRNCIESLKKIGSGDKIFVINDGEKGTLRFNDPSIEIIEHNKPYYARASALNHGMKVAAKQGFEMGIIFDDDVIVEEHCLQDHRNSWKEGNIIYKGQVLSPEQKSDQIFNEYFYYLPLLPKTLGLSDMIGNGKDKEIIKRFFSLLLHFGGTTNCSFNLKKVIGVGGFNEKFDGHWGFEDAEFYSRLIFKHNWEINMIGVAVINHNRGNPFKDFPRGDYKHNKKIWRELIDPYLKGKPQIMAILQPSLEEYWNQ